MLYAYIKGGRVDYGKVHSERNGHERFGKTYPGVVPNWGELDEAGKIQKINIIGHSFGGPTVRTLIHLLAEGSAEEREGTDPDDLSPLFEGGKVKWIHSCTTLAGTHNGVTLPEQIQKAVKPLAFTIFSLGPLTSGTWFSKVYGFHLDRFGLSSQTKHVGWDPTLLLHYINLKEDNIHWELSREGAAELTKDYTVYDNIYYFSYYGVRTAENKKGGQSGTKDMWLPMRPFAWMTGNFKRKTIGDEWMPNDGLVNIPAAHHPFKDPWQDFDPDNIKPGIWNVMPQEYKDHTSYMGVLETKEDYKNFFLEIADRVTDLPVIE
jgi:triacylglycerol lipase